MLRDGKGAPWAGLHVVEDGRLPVELGMRGEEGCRDEVFAAGVAGAGGEAHVLGHVGVHDLAGDGSAGGVRWRVPGGFGVFGGIFVAAEAATGGDDFVLVAVVVVGEILLGEGCVELAEMLLDELFGADVAGVHRALHVVGVEAGRVVADEVGVDGEVGADEVSSGLASEGRVLEAEFEVGDLVGLAVTDEPGVGVAAVVAFAHEGDKLVDVVGVLHGFAGADELGDAGGVPALEHGQGGFGDHDAGGVDAEVVAAVDEPRAAVHEDAIAFGGDNVEDGGPAFAFGVGGPVAVGDDDLAVFGGAAGGDEGAASAGCDESGWAGFALLLQEPGDVVVGDLEVGVEGDDVEDVYVLACGLDAISDALEFGAVLGLDVGHDLVVGDGAEVGPGLARFVGVLELDGLEVVGDLGGEEIAVLEADFAGSAFEMDVGPAIFLEGVGVF